jgi:hypothetical protein
MSRRYSNIIAGNVAKQEFELFKPLFLSLLREQHNCYYTELLSFVIEIFLIEKINHHYWYP